MGSDLDLLRQIRMMDGIYRRTFHAIVQPESGTAPPHGHGKLLHALEQDGPMTQKELAARLEIRPQSLTEALVRLEQLGFITRTRSEKDKREQFVHITETGRAHSQKLQTLRRQTAEKVFCGLTEAEKQQLAALLGKVIETFRETEEEKGV